MKKNIFILMSVVISFKMHAMHNFIPAGQAVATARAAQNQRDFQANQNLKKLNEVDPGYGSVPAITFMTSALVYGYYKLGGMHEIPALGLIGGLSLMGLGAMAEYYDTNPIFSSNKPGAFMLAHIPIFCAIFMANHEHLRG